MTKKHLAKLIIEMNTDDFEEYLQNIIHLLNTLEPKDRRQFSQWGTPEQQSTEEECWNNDEIEKQNDVNLPIKYSTTPTEFLAKKGLLGNKEIILSDNRLLSLLSEFRGTYR